MTSHTPWPSHNVPHIESTLEIEDAKILCLFTSVLILWLKMKHSNLLQKLNFGKAHKLACFPKTTRDWKWNILLMYYYINQTRPYPILWDNIERCNCWRYKQTLAVAANQSTKLWHNRHIYIYWLCIIPHHKEWTCLSLAKAGPRQTSCLTCFTVSLPGKNSMTCPCLRIKENTHSVRHAWNYFALQT